MAFVAIDKLGNTETTSISTTEAAINYVINVDTTWNGNGNGEGIRTVKVWVHYMDYVQKQVAFSPDFTQWDKHTREIEKLAEVAFDQSKKVIENHTRPERRLPKEIENGIYARIELLKRWIKTNVKPIRARDDYAEWKRKMDAKILFSQSTFSGNCGRYAVRTRRQHRDDRALLLRPATSQPERPPEYSWHTKLQKLGSFLQVETPQYQ